ncbi:hypothetical protein DENSPDRAFT_793010 [Dentipellis sp. KUC8613]|nr:hypothetical protein DENSPDRAFT_793010 [Dentipellis sp. KUC8613]
MWRCRLPTLRTARPLPVSHLVSRALRLSSSTASCNAYDASEDRIRIREADPVGVTPERTQHAHVQQSAKAAPASKAYAVDTLHAFLSPSNLSSSTPLLHSARTLRALYLAARARGEVRKLSAGRLSNLISIFGTLSACDGTPADMNQVHAPVTKYMDAHSFKPRWGFAMQLVRDKANAEKHLLPMDMYWFVRAQLALAQVEGIVVDPHEDAELSSAREVYLRSPFEHENPDAHIPYLYTLLRQQREGAAVELVGWLSMFLRRQTFTSPRLIELLWDTVLSDAMKSSEHLQDTLLAAVWHRLNPNQPLQHEASTNQTDSHFARRSTDGTLTNRVSPFCDNAIGLNNQLTSVLFPDPSETPVGPYGGTPSQLHIRQWAHTHARDMFYPDSGLPLSARWRNLTLLALANSPSPELAQVSLGSSDGARKLVAADFRVVAILSILERITTPTTSLDDDQIQDFVRGIWSVWVEIVEDDRRVESAMIRPMVASFLRLAAATRDDALRRACLRLCNTGFWTFHVGDDHAKRQVQMLAAEFIVASARCGQTVWEDIVAKLPHYVGLRQWQPALTEAVMRRLVALDAHAANELYTLWSGYLDIPASVAEVVAMGLVRDGEMDLAIPLLAQCTFVGRRGWETLGAVLAPLAEHADRMGDAQLAGIVSRALRDLSASPAPPPREVRDGLLWALKALAGAGHAAAAASVVRNIAALQPGYFTRGFVSSFLRALLAHRRYRIAMGLVEDGVVTDPRDVERWRAALSVHFRRAGANRLAVDMGLRAKQRWLPIALARAGTTGRFSPRRRLGFQIHKLLKGPKQVDISVDDLFQGLSILARVRGIKAAKAIYARLAPAHDERTRTALGNVLLDVSTSRRKFRVSAVRHALATPGFTPDRVSMNIVVKALLRTLPAHDVRALFDLFVSRGYPAGSHFPEGTRPFATEEALPGVLDELGLPVDVCGEELSWKRHVRPLYRMFVTALFGRGDTVGARLVVGILKELEGEEGHKRREQRKGGSAGADSVDSENTV